MPSPSTDVSRPLRIAIFGSGGAIPMAALRALHPVAEVVVVIRPGRRSPLVERLRAIARRVVRGPTTPDGLSRLAIELGVPERRMRGRADKSIAPFLRGQRLDLICVATFSWRLRADVLGAAARGTINAHASILPRHRGPNPWVWIYHADDRMAGVTIHVCDEHFDTGPILRQAQWPLERGYPVASLHKDTARRGAKLILEVIAAMAQGEVPSTPQDESQATRARRIPPGTAMVDPAWPVEHAWHFLAGVVGLFREPLSSGGVPVLYDKVPGYEVTEPRAAVGTVEKVRDGAWRLWCRDGFVQLEQGAAATPG